MTATARKHWLLAYDVRDRRRLTKVHRYVCRRGMAVQYSVFSLEGNDAQMRDWMADLGCLIDPGVDDIRAYHIPEHCAVWVYGRQQQLHGVTLYASKAVRLLMHTGSKHTGA